MKTYIFNYITTNIINGKQYVGMHITDDYNDGYLGSGLAFLKAVKKYGKENFTREILCFCKDEFEAFENEGKFIEEYDTVAPNGYNVSPKGGSGFVGWIKHSEETKRKISESHMGIDTGHRKGCRLSEEHKRKISEAGRGRVFSEESRQKKSEKLKGRVFSDETRKKMSDSAENKVFTKEHRENLSKSGKGRIPWNKGLTGCYSEEVMKRFREASLGKRYSLGSKMSEENKRKMSERKKGVKFTEEHKQKIKDSLRRYYENKKQLQLLETNLN